MKALSFSQEERRYTIVPQMRDYDAFGEKKWLPYVMTFHSPGVATSSFTTDEYGFRGTMWRGQQLRWSEYNAAEYTRAVLIGTSTAFGVGASADAYTLASLLNRREGRIWFNFAGRTFNSTQELLIFLLHLPRDVDIVVIFSGANNLVLSYLAQKTSPIYHSFFTQSVFERNLQREMVTGVRGSLKLLVHEIASKLGGRDGGGDLTAEKDKYGHVMSCFRRDMRLWALLRKALGCRLYFVLQPLAGWIHKSLTPEEQEVFALLDSSDQHGTWSGLSAYLLERGEGYVDDVREVCGELDVPFLDLNARPSFAEKRWLFVDRGHLTDGGYALVAEEIRKEGWL